MNIDPRARRPGATLAALALTFISGAAGLAHQLLWVRRMIDILGANAGTFSRVIGAFFLGLAAGAWIAARQKTPRPWRAAALAEVGVGVLALVVLAAGQLDVFHATHPAAARALTWLLPLLLVAPPALAMGLVVPWMIRAAGPRTAVSIYAVNTLGGIAGLLFVLAWALPALGLAGASLAAIGLNWLVAAFAWRLDRPDTALPEAAARGGAIGSLELRSLAFGSGFLVLGVEVILHHQLAQLLISSHFSGALVLTLVLGALGVAALLVPWFARLGRHALGLALVLAALACAAQPLTLVVQRGGLHYLPFEKPLGAYLVEALRLGLPAVVLILLPAGLVFPLLLRRAARDGIDAGRLLAINGLGGWLGAELTARLIAPMFGLWFSMAIFAAGYAACLLSQPVRWRWLALPLLAAAVAYAWKIDTRLPYAGLLKGDRLATAKVGREGVVAVVRGEPDDWRLLVNNTYTLGGSRAQVNQERQMLLPMLLHGSARRVATLGVATGSTLSGATLDPGLEKAEGIELSPLVLGFARETFAPFNRGIARDPRVQFTLGDARWVIRQRPAGFDVIEGDLFLPWNTGEGRLFTREHFAGVRAALRPRGLYCQWLPMYQLTRPQFDAILRTFREIFPEAWLIRGDFHAAMPVVGLIGGRPLSEVDWTAVEAACARVRALGQGRDPLVRHMEGVAMCVVGAPPAPPPGPLITLANGWLEWNAARNVIGLREPWFNGLPLANYLRETMRANAPRLPGPLRAAQNCGDLFLALEIAREAKLEQAARHEKLIREKLPAALRDDPEADWSRWPMRHRPKLP